MSLLRGLAWLHAYGVQSSAEHVEGPVKGMRYHPERGKRFDAVLQLLYRQLLLLITENKTRKEMAGGSLDATLTWSILTYIESTQTQLQYVDSHQPIVGESLPVP